MRVHVSSFVMIWRSLAIAVYTPFLPFTCDNWHFFWWFGFFFPAVSDSYAIHPSCPRAIRTRHKRYKQPGISFSSQSFSLLSSLTCIFFFLFLLSLVILFRLNYRTCSGRSPSPPSFYSSFMPSFHPFICLHFFSSHCQLPVLISVISASSFALFQHLRSSSIRII